MDWHSGGFINNNNIFIFIYNIKRDIFRPRLDFLCRRQDETFCLAYPWDPRRPFPLTPAFCLARVKLLRGQPHVIFRFRPEGVPIPPAEEE